MSYSLDFSEDALTELERLGSSDARKLRQILIKILSLRDNPYPQESRRIESFTLMDYKALRLDLGEMRAIYVVDEKNKKVLIVRFTQK